MTCSKGPRAELNPGICKKPRVDGFTAYKSSHLWNIIDSRSTRGMGWQYLTVCLWPYPIFPLSQKSGTTLLLKQIPRFPILQLFTSCQQCPSPPSVPP